MQLLRDKMKVKLFIGFMFMLIPYSAKAGVVIELNDYVNHDVNRVYIEDKLLRLENKREIKIVRLDRGIVYYISPKTSSYNERTFGEVRVVNAYHKKYNKDQFAGGGPKSIKVIAMQKIALQNRPFPGASLKFIGENGKKRTLIGAFSKTLSALIVALMQDPNTRQFLGSYWSEEEIETLKHGFIPLITSRMYDLVSVRETFISPKLFEAPNNYKKSDGATYYSDFAVKTLSEGLKKRGK